LDSTHKMCTNNNRITTTYWTKCSILNIIKIINNKVRFDFLTTTAWVLTFMKQLKNVMKLKSIRIDNKLWREFVLSKMLSLLWIYNLCNEVTDMQLADMLKFS